MVYGTKDGFASFTIDDGVSWSNFNLTPITGITDLVYTSNGKWYTLKDGNLIEIFENGTFSVVKPNPC